MGDGVGVSEGVMKALTGVPKMGMVTLPLLDSQLLPRADILMLPRARLEGTR